MYRSIAPAFFVLAIMACYVSCNVTGRRFEIEQKNDDRDRLNNYLDWGIYRGDKQANQYSEMGQIHAANVHRLLPVWEYRTGDANETSNMYSNPIVIDGIMYFSTPALNAVALNAVTGEEIWVFNSSVYNKDQRCFVAETGGLLIGREKKEKEFFCL